MLTVAGGVGASRKAVGETRPGVRSTVTVITGVARLDVDEASGICVVSGIACFGVGMSCVAAETNRADVDVAWIVKGDACPGVEVVSEVDCIGVRLGVKSTVGVSALVYVAVWATGDEGAGSPEGPQPVEASSRRPNRSRVPLLRMVEIEILDIIYILFLNR